jgi:cysteine sulfinate desulfinase/cysteine desulfurase-like protein
VSFAAELAAASGTLTAAQIAAATGASKRTVEGWRAGKEPIAAYRADLLTRIKRARARAERRQAACAMQAPNVDSEPREP